MTEGNLTVRDVRRQLGMTQAEFARRVGLRSAGHISDIENGAKCSVKVALAIEELSGGLINASNVSDDVALVLASRNLPAARDAAESAAA